MNQLTNVESLMGHFESFAGLQVACEIDTPALQGLWITVITILSKGQNLKKLRNFMQNFPFFL